MKERFIETARGRVYYWSNEVSEVGRPCIVFCHGVTADHSLFDMQMKNIGTYRMISWDIPLHGRSIPYNSFSFENAAEDLVMILGKERIGDIVLVGQSAGGYIAQEFIERYPERVKGFVAIGTTPFGMKYYKKSELFWIKNYAAIARMIPYRLYCKAGADGITCTKEARASIYDTLIRLGRKGMLEATTAIYEEFLKKKETVSFRCPVLLSYGEHDNTGLVKKYNRLWASDLGVVPRVIEKASHNANYDNYTVFNRMLLDFVGEL